MPDAQAAGRCRVKWHKTSDYSAASGEYAISMAVIPHRETGVLEHRFAAWYGPDLLEQPREKARPAELLGIRATAAEAKALCGAHLATMDVPA